MTLRSIRNEGGADVLYQQVSAGLPGWIGDPTGTRRPLPMGRWLGGDASTAPDRHVDEALLD
ncbi:MAG: hypothetical protein ACRDWB_06840, partial [Acidimicrobiales bacterium]